jgi:hypothetical protein
MPDDSAHQRQIFEETRETNASVTEQDVRFNCVHAAMHPSLGHDRPIAAVLADAKSILDFVNGAAS